MKTVVGLVANYQKAKSLVRELADVGFRGEEINVISKPAEDEDIEEDVYQTIEEFFGSEEYPEIKGYYAEGVQKGGVLVSVFAEDKEADRAAEIMILNGALDVEKWAKSWMETGSERQEMNAALRKTQRGQQTAWFGKVRVYCHSAEVILGGESCAVERTEDSSSDLDS